MILDDIKNWMKKNQVNQKKFSKMTGISTQEVSRFLLGTLGLVDKYVYQIENTTNGEIKSSDIFTYLSTKWRTKNSIRRFLSKFEITNSCWIWKGAIYKSGYGIFQHGDRSYRAHRFSYLFYKGKIEKNLYVCHSCDEKLCVNPSHLWLGTARENNLDCINKGRKKTKRKLNTKQEKKLIELFKNGLTQKQLAQKLNCCCFTIRKYLKEHNLEYRKEKIWMKKMEYLSIREYIYCKNLLIKDFADKIGMHPSHLSACINGKRKFSQRIAFKIKEVTGGELNIDKFTESKNDRNT